MTDLARLDRSTSLWLAHASLAELEMILELIRGELQARNLSRVAQPLGHVLDGLAALRAEIAGLP